MNRQMGSHFCGSNPFLICFLDFSENGDFLCVKIQQDNTVEWKEPVTTRFLVSKEKLQGIK